MDHKERDEVICKSYVAGLTLQGIADQHGLTRARIQQILRGAGLKRDDRRSNKLDRDIFLGVNIPEGVKEALREEAARRGVSMSALTSETMSDMLRACGYPLEADKVIAVPGETVPGGETVPVPGETVPGEVPGA